MATIGPSPLDPLLFTGTDLEKFITLRRERSQDAAVDFLLRKAQFDMLVLDSDHHYDTIMVELVLYEPLLTAGGTILLHDSLYYDGVGAAVAQLLANPRFQGVTLDSPRRHEAARREQRCPGVTIVRKNRGGHPSLHVDSRCSGWEIGDASKPSLLRDWETQGVAHNRR